MTESYGGAVVSVVEDFQAKKYGQTYEEFLKNARELTGIKDAEEALDKAYNFLIEATLLVYKVEK